MGKRKRPTDPAPANSRYINSNTYEEWLDSQDVCILLRISPRTLYNRRRKKILTGYKMVGKYYYKRSDVDKAIEQGKMD